MGGGAILHGSVSDTHGGGAVMYFWLYAVGVGVVGRMFLLGGVVNSGVGGAYFFFFLLFDLRTFSRGIILGGGLICSTLLAPGLSIRLSLKGG